MIFAVIILSIWALLSVVIIFGLMVRDKFILQDIENIHIMNYNMDVKISENINKLIEETHNNGPDKNLNLYMISNDIQILMQEKEMNTEGSINQMRNKWQSENGLSESHQRPQESTINEN